MVIIGLLVGAMLGGLIDAADGWGLVGGGLVGTLFALWAQQRDELIRLRAELTQIMTTLRAIKSRPADAAPIQAPVAQPEMPRAAAAVEPLPEPLVFDIVDDSTDATPPPLPPASAPERWTMPQPAPAAFDPFAAQPAPMATRPHSVTRAPPEPLLPESLSRHLNLENWPIKLGVVLLLIGLGALLRWAAAQGWLTVPISVRLLGVFAIAMGAVVFGYAKRDDKPAFAMTLQGGGLGAMLLVIYAALRLYGLIDSGTAFAGMLGVVALGVVLALRQDALWLALFSTGAGYLAPILTSSGSGNYTQLFGFYAILGAAVLSIAWFKRWRALNLLSFVATFGIGALWGLRYYQPENFSTIEPFLIFFFLMFVTITVLYARKHGHGGDGVDGALVFGTPFIVGLLQHRLLDNDDQMALSSVIGGSLYLGLWWLHRKREDLALLRQAHFGLAMVLYTLAIPLAFGAAWTGAIWAVEGAMVLWLGLKSQTARYIAVGYGLQVLAMLAYITQLSFTAGTPAWVNGQFFGAMLISLSAFASVRLSEKHLEQKLGTALFFIAALPWWVFAFALELPRAIPDSLESEAWVVVAALTIGLSALADRLTDSRWLGRVANLVMACMIPIVLLSTVNNYSPLADKGWLAFAAFAAAALFALRELREPYVRGLGYALAGWLLGLATLFGVELFKRLPDWLSRGSPEVLEHLANQRSVEAHWIWPEIAIFGLLLPFFALGIASALRRTEFAWPIADLYPRVRGRVETVLACIAVGSIIVLLGLPAKVISGAYLPLFNPVEAAQILALTFLTLLYLRAQDGMAPGNAQLWRRGIAGLAFAALSFGVLRAVHHYTGADWIPISSPTAQTALSLTWSFIGICAMLLGHRWQSRASWMAGAALMGLVVAKLALIDRQSLGQIEGVVAFLGAGALLAVVGYIAPAPPKEVNTPG